ncbi:MAG: bifunctional DNA primase/polymerase, partial [Ktedonobacteraceae bacterium]
MRYQHPYSQIYHTALSAQQAGINVIPVRADGSKRPALAGWRIYQQRQVMPGELEHWFRTSERGIAVVTGEISGNLEALDIDSPAIYRAWLARVREDSFVRPLYERVASGYLEATPAGGRHLLYRCSTIGRNQVLARRVLTGTRRYQTLIETRGTGGLLIIAPSGGRVHPNGKPYQLLYGGVGQVATITPAERGQLLALARTFDETPTPAREERTAYRLGTVPDHKRPGDLFNQRATWQEILCPHGWKLTHTLNGTGQWRRPGKKGPG